MIERVQRECNMVIPPMQCLHPHFSLIYSPKSIPNWSTASDSVSFLFSSFFCCSSGSMKSMIHHPTSGDSRNDSYFSVHCSHRLPFHSFDGVHCVAAGSEYANAARTHSTDSNTANASFSSHRHSPSTSDVMVRDEAM